MSKITARYVGIMLSDYLQDSYTRPGQFLCMASLGGDVKSTMEQLLNDATNDATIPESITDSEIGIAFRKVLRNVDLRYIDENGTPQDEPPEDRDGDEPNLYIVLEWEVEPSHADYLRDLARRLHNVPATWVDEGDIDKLRAIAKTLDA